MNVASGVARWIGTQDLGSYSPDGVGGDLFVDTFPDQPDRAAMVTVNGGPDRPGWWGHGWTVATVQVLVRGDVDPRVSQRRASAILEAFRAAAYITLTDSDGSRCRLVGTTPRQSHPVRVGPDDNRRHLHSLNVDLMIEPD